MRVLITALYLLLTIFYIFPENSDNTNDKNVKQISITEQYKETIQFGIEKEIIGILNELGTNPKEEFLSLLFDRYKEAVLVDTKTALILYFSNCDKIPDNILNYLFDELKNEPTEKKLHIALIDFIGKKGNTEQAKLLIDRLDNYDTSIQSAAAGALSKIKNKDIIEPILDRLKLSDNDPEKFLSPDIKSQLVLYFGEVQAAEASSYLREIIQNPANDKYVIMYSMISLAKIKDKESISLIEKNLSNDEVRIQEYAAYALSLFEDPEVIPILNKMLKNNNEKIRVFACQGIVLNKNISSVNILLYKFKNDPAPSVKKEALSSLIYLGEPGIKALKDFMQDKKYSAGNLYIISDAVRKTPNESNVRFIIELYDNEDKSNKEVIAKNLVNGNSNKLDPFIIKLLESDDYLLRLGALKAINNIKDSTLWNKLVELSKNDPAELVKNTAKRYMELKN